MMWWWENFKRWKPVVKLLQALHPNYGTCGICGLPWCNCESHTVLYKCSSSYFIVCQHCYDRSSYDTVLDASIRYWHRNHCGLKHIAGLEYWPFIQATVKDLNKNKKEFVQYTGLSVEQKQRMGNSSRSLRKA